MLDIVKEIRPDVIALGYDQRFDEKKLGEQLKKEGLDIKIVRCSHYTEDDLNGTRRIIRKIADRIASNELYSGEEE